MLNIVFFNRVAFPEGNAMSKRHRLMIDYLCKDNNVRVSKYVSWKSKIMPNENSIVGLYNDKVFYQNTRYKPSIWSLLGIFIEGCKFLKKNCVPGDKNVVIFSTVLEIEQICAFWYARHLGYKIVFDVVENMAAPGTSITFSKKMSLFISKLCYKYANAFLVISTHLSHLFSQYRNKPICLMPNSVTRCPNINKKTFSKTFNIVYAGTFAPKDGISFLVKGFDLFSQRYTNVELILIGRKNSSLDKETEQILKENSKISVKGFVDESTLNYYLRHADILAMTRCNSKFANYGFPFKLSEYLSTGNTVIATNVGDVSKYILDGVNAYLIPPEDTNAIANIMEYIYNNEEEAIMVGKRGQYVVDEYFDINKNGKMLVNFLLKEVCV